MIRPYLDVKYIKLRFTVWDKDLSAMKKRFLMLSELNKRQNNEFLSKQFQKRWNFEDLEQKMKIFTFWQMKNREHNTLILNLTSIFGQIAYFGGLGLNLFCHFWDFPYFYSLLLFGV